MSLHRTDLVMFPPAGGSRAAFRDYRSQLVEARLLFGSLPGRGVRYSEPPINAMEPLVQHFVNELVSAATAPVVLFGHSLGALIAFEVARRLPTPPKALFVAGSDAPSVRQRPSRARAEMSDAEFIEELRHIGGTPGTVLDNRELLSFMMPALRADFAIVDTYEYGEAEPLECPIYVLNGESDQATTPAGLDAWAECTGSRAIVTTMPGTHFFVQEHPELVQAFMRKSLRHSSAVA